jgi:hypothetical protein
MSLEQKKFAPELAWELRLSVPPAESAGHPPDREVGHRPRMENFRQQQILLDKIRNMGIFSSVNRSAPGPRPGKEKGTAV